MFFGKINEWLQLRKELFQQRAVTADQKIHRRTAVVGIVSNADVYARLVTTYLVEYAEDWSASRASFSEQSVGICCDKRFEFSFLQEPFCDQYLMRAVFL